MKMIPAIMFTYMEITASPQRLPRMSEMFLKLNSSFTLSTKNERITVETAITSNIALIMAGNKPGPARLKSPMG